MDLESCGESKCLLQWKKNILKIISFGIGTCNPLKLQETMVLLFRKSLELSDVYEEKMKVKRMKVLCSTLRGFLSHCHFRANNLCKAMSSPTYEELVAAILSVIIKLEVAIVLHNNGRSVQSMRKIVRDLFLYLGDKPVHIWDAILRSSNCCQKHSFLNILFQRVHEGVPKKISSPESYLKYLMMIRLWRKCAETNEEQDKVVSMANNIRLPGKRFAKWIKSLPVEFPLSFPTDINEKSMVKRIVCDKLKKRTFQGLKDVLLCSVKMSTNYQNEADAADVFLRDERLDSELSLESAPISNEEKLDDILSHKTLTDAINNIQECSLESSAKKPSKKCKKRSHSQENVHDKHTTKKSRKNNMHEVNDEDTKAQKQVSKAQTKKVLPAILTEKGAIDTKETGNVGIPEDIVIVSPNAKRRKLSGVFESDESNDLFCHIIEVSLENDNYEEENVYFSSALEGNLTLPSLSDAANVSSQAIDHSLDISMPILEKELNFNEQIQIKKQKSSIPQTDFNGRTLKSSMKICDASKDLERQREKTTNTPQLNHLTNGSTPSSGESLVVEDGSVITSLSDVANVSLRKEFQQKVSVLNNLRKSSTSDTLLIEPTKEAEKVTNQDVGTLTKEICMSNKEPTSRLSDYLKENECSGATSGVHSSILQDGESMINKSRNILEDVDVIESDNSNSACSSIVSFDVHNTVDDSGLILTDSDQNSEGAESTNIEQHEYPIRSNAKQIKIIQNQTTNLLNSNNKVCDNFEVEHSKSVSNIVLTHETGCQIISNKLDILKKLKLPNLDSDELWEDCENVDKIIDFLDLEKDCDEIQNASIPYKENLNSASGTVIEKLSNFEMQKYVFGKKPCANDWSIMGRFLNSCIDLGVKNNVSKTFGVGKDFRDLNLPYSEDISVMDRPDHLPTETASTPCKISNVARKEIQKRTPSVCLNRNLTQQLLELEDIAVVQMGGYSQAYKVIHLLDSTEKASSEEDLDVTDFLEEDHHPSRKVLNFDNMQSNQAHFASVSNTEVGSEEDAENDVDSGVCESSAGPVMKAFIDQGCQTILRSKDIDKLTPKITKSKSRCDQPKEDLSTVLKKFNTLKLQSPKLNVVDFTSLSNLQNPEMQDTEYVRTNRYNSKYHLRERVKTPKKFTV